MITQILKGIKWFFETKMGEYQPCIGFFGFGASTGWCGKRHLILSQTHLGTVNAASFVDQWRNSGGLYRRFRILPSNLNILNIDRYPLVI
jgi:hypothetical protein